MKVFMIGGTGLLGSEGAGELIRRGHEVSSVALPPIPEGAPLPPEMKLSLGNYMELTDEELSGHMKGCEGFIFAAGVDERVEGPPPIYDLYEKYNIKPLKRLLEIAKDSGVKHAVILGSYFAYFDRVWTDLQLYRTHPYIRSRVDQANMALSFAGGGMDVSVLELPYIFGAQPGRKPVWVFLVEQIQKMKGATFYPGGGTTMVTVKQVGQCIAGALERGRGGKNYPIGYYNLTWKEMLTIMHRHMGLSGRKVITIPPFLYRQALKPVLREQEKKGIQSGLDLMGLVKIMTRKAFIDQETAVQELGVEADDIERAIGESVRLSLEILDGRRQTINMKGE